MVMILVIDNYDSFTFNLVQYLGILDQNVEVVRNDEVTVDQVMTLGPQQIVISPGPGRPEEAGMIVNLVQRVGSEIPVLGVCLGHQAIGVAYGARVVPAVRLMHGKEDRVHHRGGEIFRGVPEDFRAGRYHSLAIAIETGSPLEIAATSDDGTIMAVSHRSFPVYGIQFHPESILTPDGMQILKNFVGLPSPQVVLDQKHG